ncbi:MAG: DUF4845 domain-containing protein [Acidobacteria bacterium]|nr:DUF4845 domain-containing protein [Acidobacteriota bacterium]
MKARGGGKLQLLIGLAITAALILGAVRIIPVYVKSYELRDAIRSQAKFAGVERKSADTIKEELYTKARELNLPVRREAIQVTPRSLGVQITVRYTVQVDLIVYKPNLNFNYSSDTSTAY